MIDLMDVQILAVVSLVFLAFVAGHLLRSYNIHWFPESAAAVVLGSIYAVIWFFIPDFNNEGADFNPDSFFLVLLPIIIFESGYSVHKVRIRSLHVVFAHPQTELRALGRRYNFSLAAPLGRSQTSGVGLGCEILALLSVFYAQIWLHSAVNFYSRLEILAFNGAVVSCATHRFPSIFRAPSHFSDF